MASENPTLDLVEAIEDGSLKHTKKALKQGAQIEYRTPVRGLTPLMLATHKGESEIVQVLVNANAEVNSVSVWGYRTPLMFAALNNSVESARILLSDERLDLNVRGRMCALFVAARQGNIEIVKLIVAKRFEKNLDDNCLISAREVAELNKHADVIKELNF